MEVTPISASGVRPTTDDHVNAAKVTAAKNRASAVQQAKEKTTDVAKNAAAKQVVPDQAAVGKKEVPTDLAVEKIAASIKRSDPSMDLTQAIKIAQQILGANKDQTSSATQDETKEKAAPSVDTRI